MRGRPGPEPRLAPRVAAPGEAPTRAQGPRGGGRVLVVRRRLREPRGVTLRGMALVPKQRTPLTEQQIVEALHAGHLDVFHVNPRASRLATAYAQVCLETGCGQKGLWNYNFGNLSCWSSDPCDQFSLTRDTLGGDAVRTMRYRSYASASEGAAQYWRTLAGRYVSALSLFDSGDEAAIARELGRLRYFTAPVADYAANLTFFARRFVTKFDLLSSRLDAAEDLGASLAGAPSADEMRRSVASAEADDRPGIVQMPEIVLTTGVPS